MVRKRQDAGGRWRSQQMVVAQPSTGPRWQWCCRLDERGNDVIDEWVRGLSKKARMNFERQRDHLSQLELGRWSRPQACAIGDHIYVIHFKDESGMQWRPCGHIDLGRSAFVFTVVAYEKDRVYHPSDYVERAKRHRDSITADFHRHAGFCFQRNRQPT